MIAVCINTHGIDCISPIQSTSPFHMSALHLMHTDKSGGLKNALRFYVKRTIRWHDLIPWPSRDFKVKAVGGNGPCEIRLLRALEECLTFDAARRARRVTTMTLWRVPARASPRNLLFAFINNQPLFDPISVAAF